MHDSGPNFKSIII